MPVKNGEVEGQEDWTVLVDLLETPDRVIYLIYLRRMNKMKNLYSSEFNWVMYVGGGGSIVC